jgi:hypothetical protein
MKTRVLLSSLAALVIATAALRPAFSSPFGNESELSRIEKEYEALIKKEKPDAAHLFHLHLIAARELNAHGFKAKAREYYLKAMAVKTTEDKSEPAIELFHLSLQDFMKSGKAEQARKDLTQALAAISDPDKKKYIQDLASGLLDGKVENNPLRAGMAGQAMLESKLVSFVEKKRYAEAFSMLDRESTSKSDIQSKITYDVLAVSVIGKKAAPLLCEETFKKYPKSYSYSVISCDLLLYYLATGSKSAAKLEKLREFFRTEKSSQKYLLSILEDLK